MKELNVAQQLVLYFFPIITNLCFVNIGLVSIRLACFEKRLGSFGMGPWLAASSFLVNLKCLLSFQRQGLEAKCGCDAPLS